ncbi:hypothetical protein T492DRAFT_938106 [Pavlovales sp. CCMP2436]|nr:hypothetical protein T492DRAFT_938106 [Pavlovales sp. CCMP2436]
MAQALRKHSDHGTLAEHTDTVPIAKADLTHDNRQALGLEIEHENSNSGETECRDGTVSWFHGVRFFPGEVAPGTIDGLCLGKFRRVGWHPHMFRNPRGCWGEWWGLWGACWEQTCREVAAEIWGCARRTDRPCETPFVRSLLQVRHPLRVVESLGVKFCESADAAVNPDISHIFAAMWPANADKFSSSESGCLRAIAWYWTLYHESLEGALESGALHGWYRVEGSTACGIARLAGFDRPETAIFQPSVAQYHERCVSNPLPKKQRPSVNQRNRGKLHVQPSQIDELDSELGQRMRTLALRFGYLYEDDPAEGAAEESDAAKPPKRAGRKLVRQRVGDGDNDWKGARDSVHRN